MKSKLRHLQEAIASIDVALAAGRLIADDPPRSFSGWSLVTRDMALAAERLAAARERLVNALIITGGQR